MQKVVLGIVFFGYLFIFLCHGQEIGQDFHCIPCHEDVVNQENIYWHPPFLQQNCSFCHLTLEEPPPEDMNHENRLQTRNAIGIDVCYKCHTIEKLGVSHPVGIYSSEKIQIPEVLPTGSEGQLLCITCHFPHGSDEEYRGRKPVSFQLCIACHGRDYYE
jgi:predicted CXXCH cytochrome family protein